MGKIFFTSDTHINHKNIIKYSKRPFSSIEEMNEVIACNINKKVSKNDILYHLGDLAFNKINKTKEWLDKIDCSNIHLILGNHDNVQDCFKLKEDGYLVSVHNYLELKRYDHYRRQICMMHYPITVWNSCHRGSYLLHGHCHGSHNEWKEKHMPNALSFDVGVDCNSFHPISLERIDDIMQVKLNRQLFSADHHF